MFALPLLFVVLLFIGCRFQKNEDYLSLSQTTSINGLFFLCVFFKHIQNFAVYYTGADRFASVIDNYLGQLIVVPFLFYSGYGISESIKNKPGYVKNIPVKKILKTWFMFALYVLIWVAIKIPIGQFYALKDILIALTAWTSIGNLQWYVFAMLALWLGTWICFSLFKKGISPYIAMLFYTLVYAVVMRCFKDTKWYDTVIAYDIGLFVSFFRQYLNKIYDNTKLWAVLTAVSAGLFVYLTVGFTNSIILMAAKDGLLCALLILVSMRMKIGNPIIFFMGKYLLGMYLMHNIAMILLKRISYMKTHNYAFTFAALALSALLAWVFVSLCNLFIKQISKLTSKMFRG